MSAASIYIYIYIYMSHNFKIPRYISKFDKTIDLGSNVLMIFL